MNTSRVCPSLSPISLASALHNEIKSPVSAVKCLILKAERVSADSRCFYWNSRWIPPNITKHNVIAAGQVQACRAGFERHQDDLDFWVILDNVERLLPSLILHCTVILRSQSLCTVSNVKSKTYIAQSA